MLIVQPSDSSTEGLDTGRGAVLTSSRGDRNTRRAGETAFDLIIGFGGTLAQIRPFSWIFCETVFCRTFRTPDDTCRGTRGIEAGVRTVTFVSASKLTMGFRSEF